MKTLAFNLLATLGVCSLTAACAWQDFDTIEDTTWATSIDQPGAVGDSDTWATAVEPAGLNSFAVFGQGKASVVVMSLNDKGELVTVDKDTRAKTYADTKIIALHASAPDGVGFAYLAGSVIEKWNGSSFEATADDASGSETALAYGQVGSSKKSVSLQGVTLKISGVAGCDLPGGAVAAMAMIGPDQLLVWEQSGAINVFNPSTVAATTCARIAPVVLMGDTTTKAGQIVTVGDDARIYLGGFSESAVGSAPTNGKLFSITRTKGPNATFTAQPPVSIPGLSSIGVIRNGADELIAVGAPNEIIRGVNNAGQVTLYKGATLSDPVVLHDAQPNDDQNFGRGVVGVQINGKPVVIVAAEGEILAYFKTAAFQESRAK